MLKETFQPESKTFEKKNKKEIVSKLLPKHSRLFKPMYEPVRKPNTKKKKKNLRTVFLLSLSRQVFCVLFLSTRYLEAFNLNLNFIFFKNYIRKKKFSFNSINNKITIQFKTD